jgi:hypothetical protein
MNENNQQRLPLTSQPVQIAQCQPTISLNQMNQHQYQMNPYQQQIFNKICIILIIFKIISNNNI